MKHLHFIGINLVVINALIFLTGCASTAPYKKMSLPNNIEGYAEYRVSNDIMGPATGELELLQKHETLLSEGSQPINFEEATEANQVYNLGKDEYRLQDSAEKYTLKKGGKVIFTAPMCYGAAGPIADFRRIEGELTFTFSGPCHYEGNKVLAESNVFYKDETMNEKYGLEESKFLFAYQGKAGFIGKKDGEWKIYFNEKAISTGYESISPYACCAAPYLFTVYENGALVFLAGKQHQNYLVEIDLNTHL